MSTGSSRLTETLLAVLNISLVETLVVVNFEKMLVRQTDCGVTVSIGDEAMAEFMQHAQAWSVDAHGCPIVVQKNCTMDPTSGCENRCVLLDLVELKQAVSRLDDSCIVFQRFVIPRVRGCPSIVRVAWRDSLAPRGFRLKSGVGSWTPEQLKGASLDERLARWTVSSWMPGTQATELRSIPSSVLNVLDQTTHFTQTVFGLQLTQVVVDCLQDEQGLFHFSQVKAFTAQPQWLRRMRSIAMPSQEDWQSDLRGDAAPGVSKKRGSTKKSVMPTAICSMCACSQRGSKLGKRMTVKMMLETEHHLRKRGLQLFHVSRVRAINLSDLMPVCDSCWSLYLAETELLRAETRLAKAVGIDVCGGAVDEAYVPFGGVLSSVRSEREQADFGGVHRSRDPFRIHNPLPAPRITQGGSSSSQGGSVLGKGAEWPSILRRGGEALAFDDASAPPVSSPVPSAVLQHRMMIHINRLTDMSPELRELMGGGNADQPLPEPSPDQGKLVLRMEVPWQPESPRDVQLQALDGHDDLSIHRTAVFFIFNDPASQRPLHSFLSQSMVRFSILLSSNEGVSTTHSTSVSSLSKRNETKHRELITGTVSLERMVESVSEGFLAQTWVMFCRDGKTLCQLKVTLGLACDHTVPSEYVALKSYADAFVPYQPYISSEVLPTTWMASIMGDKSYIPARAGGSQTADLLSKHRQADDSRADALPGPSAEAIQRECPALLGGPLLLAPRPQQSALATQSSSAAAPRSFLTSSTVGESRHAMEAGDLDTPFLQPARSP
jgi:hypothetical protein